MISSVPYFIYKALSDNGEQIKGEVWADSKDQLNHQLGTKGLLLQSARTKNAFLSKASNRKIKLEQFQLFNQEFIALLKAGVSVTESLKEIADRPDHAAFSSALNEIHQHVMAGEGLSASCRRYPEFFEPLYLSALETGESIGNLASTLIRYQKQLISRITLQRQFSQALVYPAFLVILLSFVMVILFTFVLPRFVTLYADFGSELPIATQWLIYAVDTLPVWGTISVIVIVLSSIFYQAYIKTEQHRQNVDTLLLSLPFIGSILKVRVIAQLTRTMSSLLASGMTMVDAMTKTAFVLTNRAYAHKLNNASELIIAGTSFSSSIEQQNIISGSAQKILRAGEKAGDMANILDEIADYYEQILSYQLTRFTSILEPLLMLIVGVAVGGIILVMYLPIFSMAEIIQ